MKKMSYAEAIREGMSIRMREDPNVLLFGEDVGAFGGCFGVTAGMFDGYVIPRFQRVPLLVLLSVLRLLACVPSLS